jgi:hypothetical protein
MRRPRLVTHGDSPGTGLPGKTSSPLPEKTTSRRQHRARWPNVSVGTACPARAATTTTGTTSGTGEPRGAVRAAVGNPADAAAYVNKHYPAGGRGDEPADRLFRVLRGPGAAGRAGALSAPATTRGRLQPVCFGRAAQHGWRADRQGEGENTGECCAPGDLRSSDYRRSFNRLDCPQRAQQFTLGRRANLHLPQCSQRPRSRTGRNWGFVGRVSVAVVR